MSGGLLNSDWRNQNRGVMEDVKLALREKEGCTSKQGYSGQTQIHTTHDVTR